MIDCLTDHSQKCVQLRKIKIFRKLSAPSVTGALRINHNKVM